MTDISRQAIFKAAARQLLEDFRALSTVPHKAIKGAEAESLLREFLNRHLPKKVRSDFRVHHRSR